MIYALVSSGPSVCALRPHRMATKGLMLPSGLRRLLSALIAASVTISYPLS